MGETQQTVSLSLFRFDKPSARIWPFFQMALARRPLSRLRGLRFVKLCGTGSGEGFTPVPNTAVYTILCVWDSANIAHETVATAPVFVNYRAHADASCTLFLQVASARGQWSHQAPFTPVVDLPDGPIAALTRATVRPHAMLQFWKRAGPISDVVGDNQDVVFKIGMGEVPWVQQVTFSIWPDTTTMAAFARADGPHARAIKAVRDGKWFREELYARFRILDRLGDWPGLSTFPETAER
ncbi:spheroidene monooxygenase [Tropicimonas sp. IMCC34043]|uniref:spheroidene monooxygenase n=1 Tax=Tropicimonas sp. IMCC34043 TaxID=2248760 RepID=UPI000E277070|nr:spheroidene monooxygenase [Tropicimonas sp. IMCC34043]